MRSKQNNSFAADFKSLFDKQSRARLTDMLRECQVDPVKLKQIIIEDLHAKYLAQNYRFALERDALPSKTFDQTFEQNRAGKLELTKELFERFDYSLDKFRANPDDLFYIINSVMMRGISTKLSVHFILYCKTVLMLGTAKHRFLLDRAWDMRDVGCFMLTEMSHGSNVGGMLTCAHYLPETGGFELNSVTGGADKFWIGNLVESANIGVVFARLIAGGHDRGIHAFVVELRDERGRELPGVDIRDCGVKMELDEIDNGTVRFTRVRLPGWALLDKHSRFENGRFVSSIKKKSHRFTKQIQALAGGRLTIGLFSAKVSLIFLSYAYLAECAGLRVSGASPATPTSGLGSQTRRAELVNLVSANVLYLNLVYMFYAKWSANKTAMNTSPEHQALTSYLKCVVSWNGVRCLATCREIAGLAGKASAIASIWRASQVQVTWDGANEVLFQQTAKILLQQFFKAAQGRDSDIASLSFLESDYDQSRTLDRVRSLMELPHSPGLDRLLGALRALLECRLQAICDLTVAKFARQVAKFEGSFFSAFNSVLPLYLFPGSCFYGELATFDHMAAKLDSKVTGQLLWGNTRPPQTTGQNCAC